MDYQFNTHCPNCFSLSNTPICSACKFDRRLYFEKYIAVHHLPLFTGVNKTYVIGRVLAENNLAIVYAAIRTEDQQNCVIKEFFPRDLAGRGLNRLMLKSKNNEEELSYWQTCFLHEAELLRSCYEEPSVEFGVVRYMASFSQHNSAYLVMERLTGETLADYLKRQKRLSPQQIGLWLKPVLETLQKLHDKEIYHRQINPNNIFLQAPDQPVLMDFGLGRTEVQDKKLNFYSSSNACFIAPELFTTDYYDQRTDLYALGAVIYLCLYGEAPPSAEARKQGAVLKTSNTDDEVIQDLQATIGYCLQLNVNLRPKNVEYLLTHLSTLWTEQASTEIPALDITPVRTQTPPPPSPFDLPPSPILTKPHSFVRALGLFLGVIMGLVGLGYGGFTAYQAYDKKITAQRKADNLLFSQAQSLTDYKKYLTSCITCENKERALERIEELEQEKQSQLAKEKQQAQDAVLFSKAQTVEDFKRYLSNCVLCADKAKAEESIAQLTGVLKAANEKQLGEQEQAFIGALKTTKGRADFYQQSCVQNLPFWQRTATQGYALAQLFLGGCYSSGQGVKQDYAEAVKWYSKAAAQGNVYAQSFLGQMYQNGEGVAQSEQEAAKWYKQAAEQGDALAQYWLGKMYEHGEGVNQDYKQAIDWYLRSAEQGNADAQFNLAVMYHYGSGVNQDYQAALTWYRKSAEQNNDKAQYLLGIMYQQGYGVNVNEQEALKWYQKAAQQGNADAIGQMKSLELSMMPADKPENIETQTEKYLSY